MQVLTKTCRNLIEIFSGSFINSMTSRLLVNGIVRVAQTNAEVCLDLSIKTIAKSHWGSNWLIECLNSVGKKFKVQQEDSIFIGYLLLLSK